MNEELKKDTSLQNVSRRTINSNIVNVLLYLSFCVASLMPTILICNEANGLYASIGFTSGLEDKILFLFLYAGFSYFIFNMFVKAYIFVMSFNIYAVLIPQKAFLDCFKISYLIRNLVVAAISIVVLFNPLLFIFFELFTLICDVFMFVGFFAVFYKKYIDKISSPFIFKVMSKPFFTYLVLRTLFLFVGVIG